MSKVVEALYADGQVPAVSSNVPVVCVITIPRLVQLAMTAFISVVNDGTPL